MSDRVRAGVVALVGAIACSSGGSGGSGNPIAPGPNLIPEVSLSGGASVDADLPITLTVQASDEDGITEIVIDWDDGTVDRLQVGGATSHQAPVTHVFGRVGIFRVEATAMDTRQATGRVVRSVTTRGGGVDIGLEHGPGSAPLIARVTVTVGSRTESVLDGGVVRVSDLVPGEHLLTAEAVRSDCVIEGDPTRTVRVDAGSTARADFSITCTFVPEERILYNPQSPEGFGEGIASARPDGSGQRLLTDRNGPAFPNGIAFPTWSPDGTRILSGFSDLWIMNYDGTELTRVGRGGRPAWSPDGRSIAFELDGDLAVADLVGRRYENVVFLTNDGGSFGDEGPSWSPDGSALVFHRDNVIHVVEADGSNLRELVPGIAAVWMADGRRIVFAHRGETQQIASIRPDGSDLRILTDLSGEAGHPDPSPQGDRIVFHSPRGQEARLWIMNSDGTDPRVIDAIPAPVGHANWGPP